MRKLIIFFSVFCFTSPSLAVSDPYRLFGLLPGPSLSEEDIDRAFRRIKFRIHPDHHGNSPESQERFRELKSAYDNLKDPNFRTSYDNYLRKSQVKLPEEPNLYKVLGVLSDSSPAELTGAYREIRGRIHPDRHGGDSRFANERLREVQQAHETLIDPGLRAKHDRILQRVEKEYPLQTQEAGAVVVRKPPSASAAPHQPAPLLRDNKIHRVIKSGGVYTKDDWWPGENFIKRSVLEALDSGEDINALSADGLSPLSLAIKGEMPIGFLFNLGADAGVPNADGSFPIHVFLKTYLSARLQFSEYLEAKIKDKFPPLINGTPSNIIRDKGTNSLLEMAVRGKYPSPRIAVDIVSTILNRGGGTDLTRSEWKKLIRESEARVASARKRSLFSNDIDIYTEISRFLEVGMYRSLPPDESPKGGRSQAQESLPPNSKESRPDQRRGESWFAGACRSLFGLSK